MRNFVWKKFCLWLTLSFFLLQIVPFFSVAASEQNLRMEAENMKLSGYNTASISSASGGKGIVKPSNERMYGTATAPFEGETGIYTVKIYYFDESDGASRYKLSVDGTWVGSWTAGADYGNTGAGSNNRVCEEIWDVSLRKGSVITLYGCMEQWEYGRVDCIDFVPQAALLTPEKTKESYADFGLDEQGYVRIWFQLGVLNSFYGGKETEEYAARTDVILNTPLAVNPSSEEFESISTVSGERWNLYAMGKNIFVEDYRFYYNLTVCDMYGYTELLVPEDMTVKARVWMSNGGTEVWCNGAKVYGAQTYGTNAGYKDLFLSLKQGRNRVMIRKVTLGARNTTLLFGLQILENQENVKVSLPGDEESIRAFYDAETWLYTVKRNQDGSFSSEEAAPSDVYMTTDTARDLWKAGERIFSPKQTVGKSQISAVLHAGKIALKRNIELPDTSRIVILEKDPKQYRQTYLSYIEENNNMPSATLLAKHLLGTKSGADRPMLASVLQEIDECQDTADFKLACLLRLYRLGGLSSEEMESVKNTALGFRYWQDEPGMDSMWFTTENHEIMFRSCQLVAGNLFADDVFLRSGRTGKEQAEIAKRAIDNWMTTVEEKGFREFLSGAYAPVTMSGLLNISDFSEDENLAERAEKLLDRMFYEIADHAFDGVTAGPQDRAYREGVLYPQNNGTQAMLSFVMPGIPISLSPWMTFLASADYVPPSGLERRISASVEKRSFEGNAEIVLKKSKDYILSSVVLPSYVENTTYIPGNKGEQEILWYASLAGDTHVFVSHPGATAEASMLRPAYWNGNGILPTLKQKGNILTQIYNIPEDYPVGFTHAHWPSENFDAEIREENWVFGRKNNGYIALWCSENMVEDGDVLLGRELRAYGKNVAWMCVVSSKNESESLEAFMETCKKMNPYFDPETNSVSYHGAVQLTWQEDTEFTGTKTSVSSDYSKITIKLDNMDRGKYVILALYDGKRLTEIHTVPYDGNDVYYFPKTGYTKVKVMIWDDWDGLVPIQETEVMSMES